MMGLMMLYACTTVSSSYLVVCVQDAGGGVAVALPLRLPGWALRAVRSSSMRLVTRGRAVQVLPPPPPRGIRRVHTIELLLSAGFAGGLTAADAMPVTVPLRGLRPRRGVWAWHLYRRP